MTINEDIKKILENTEKLEGRLNQVEQKKFKLPFGKNVGKAQKKNNYVTVLIINENGNIDFRKYKIDDQTLTHDLIPRLAGAGYVMYWKNAPFIILPNWSVEPFSPLVHYNNSLVNGQNTAGYKLLMAKMLKEQISSATHVSGWIKWILGGGLLALVIYAIISGGGG